jgi:hypothetical protein
MVLILMFFCKVLQLKDKGDFDILNVAQVETLEEVKA